MPSQRQRRHSRPFDIFSSDSCSCLGVLLLNERFHHPSSHLSHKPGLPLWPSRLHTIIIHLLVVLLPFFLFEWVPAILYRLTSNSSSQQFLLFEFPVAAGTTGIYGCAWHSCRYSKSLCSLTQRSYTDVHGLNGSEHTQICWITGKIWYAVWFAIFWGQHVGWSLYHILRQMSNSTKKIKKQLSAFIHFQIQQGVFPIWVISLYSTFPFLVQLQIRRFCWDQGSKCWVQSAQGGSRSWPFY